jgi:tRNA A37 threonylcarbamoyladenosine synthetase subunit TsaC/SUA5/YrdC
MISRKALAPRVRHLLLNLNYRLQFEEAVRRVVHGHQVVAVNFRTFGLLGPAANEDETHKISLPKGINDKKPHTLLLRHISDILPAIDFTRIHPLLRPILQNSHKFYSRVAHISHVRIPVKPGACVNKVLLHSGVLSFEDNNVNLPLAQFLMFTGKSQNFITSCYEQGAKLLAVTSMNYHNQPTITNLQNAMEFLEKSQLNTLLYQPRVNIQPSYPGISLSTTGVTLVREGHVKTATIISNWQDVPFQFAPGLKP